MEPINIIRKIMKMTDAVEELGDNKMCYVIACTSDWNVTLHKAPGNAGWCW